MKVLFIQKLFFEYIGISYLSACLREEGFSVDLLIEGKYGKIRDYIKKTGPDCVAMSIVSGYEDFYSRVADIAKGISASILVIAGGPHITFFPQYLRGRNFDFGIIGEADYILPRALKNLNSVRLLPNIVMEGRPPSELENLTEDLDLLPFPDRDLYLTRYPLLRNIPNKHFVTGRGCPYECSFCFNITLKEIYFKKGRFVRRLSPLRVIQEIESIKERYPLDIIRFDDDVFTLDLKWLAQFLPLYKERIRLPFSCLIRANNFSDETGRLLKDSGCHFAQFGIESGNNRLRNIILNKKIEREDILKTAEILRNNNIMFGTFNMLNIPTEDYDMAFETLQINRDIRTDLPWCSVIQPYPKTRLAEFAVKKKLIDYETLHNIKGSYFNKGLLWNKDSRKLIRMQKLFFLLCRLNLNKKITMIMVSLPLNVIYNMIFLATFGYRYLKTYRIGIINLIRLGLKTKGDF